MILIELAKYVTELLSYDETKVIVGRENAVQKTFEENYILVDSLSPAKILTSLKSYDDAKEILTITNILKGTFTLELYGKDAYMNTYKFLAMQNSQFAKDLEKKYQIMVGKGENINNIKQQAGGRYYNRYEIEITIQYNEILQIDALRIEEIPRTFLINN